jgi:aryl carrier-like protein
MTFVDWKAAINPKVPATLNIHEALKEAGTDLDFFVCFTSVSGAVGQSGQANYAAGNTFNNAFVQYRRSLGMAASSLDIGVVEDVGYVSENKQVLETLRAAAYHLLSERDLLESLHLAISRGRAPGASSLPPKPTLEHAYCNEAHISLGMRSNLPLADPDNRCIWRRDPRMGAYRDDTYATAATLSSSSSERPGTDKALARFVMSATANPTKLSSEESHKFLTDQIRARVASFLMLSAGDEMIDDGMTLTDAGVDSLVAIELRNWWKQSLGSDISVLELLNENLKQLGEIAAERLQVKLLGNKPSDNVSQK